MAEAKSKHGACSGTGTIFVSISGKTIFSGAEDRKGRGGEVRLGCPSTSMRPAPPRRPPAFCWLLLLVLAWTGSPGQTVNYFRSFVSRLLNIAITKILIM